MKANLLSAVPSVKGLGATAMAFIVASSLVASGFAISAQAADLGAPGVVMAPVPAEGVPCVFEESGPDIVLPWSSVWLGHFSGGRFVNTSTGAALDWHDDKMCFPTRASCNRWVHDQSRYFHRPEGYTTCLMIR